MPIPEPIRSRLVAGVNRWHAFRASRVTSVRNVAVANTREAFDRLYGSPELMSEYLGPERLAFYEEVASRCVAEGPFRRVVDVGCGSGHLLAALLRHVEPLELAVGVDDSEQAIVRLAEVVPEALGVVESVYELERRLQPESFDLVICTEVLEHLDRPLDALEQLQRLRAPSGRIVATVPDGEIDDFEGHVSFWSLDEFRSLLERAGSAWVERLDDGSLYGVVDG